MNLAKSDLTRYDPFGDLDDLFKGFMLWPVRFELPKKPGSRQAKIVVQ